MGLLSIVIITALAALYVGVVLGVFLAEYAAQCQQRIYDEFGRL